MTKREMEEESSVVYRQPTQDQSASGSPYHQVLSCPWTPVGGVGVLPQVTKNRDLRPVGLASRPQAAITSRPWYCVLGGAHQIPLSPVEYICKGGYLPNSVSCTQK